MIAVNNSLDYQNKNYNNKNVDDIMFEAKQYIAIDFMDYQDEDIYHNNFDMNAIFAAKKKSYEKEKNVILENNMKKPIPDQLLTQTIDDDIYATEGVAEDDFNDDVTLT